MKKWFVILFLFLVPAISSRAQDDDAPQEGKIQERMREYIQDKLGLSKAEAQKFTPVFIRYFREFAQTHRQFKGDKLILKQRIIDLRIRYRTEFRQVMDETRADKVYHYEDVFRREAKRIILENRRERPVRRTKNLID
jgi:hypothetical protein